MSYHGGVIAKCEAVYAAWNWTVLIGARQAFLEAILKVYLRRRPVHERSYRQFDFRNYHVRACHAVQIPQDIHRRHYCSEGIRASHEHRIILLDVIDHVVERMRQGAERDVFKEISHSQLECIGTFVFETQGTERKRPV